MKRYLESLEIFRWIGQVRRFLEYLELKKIRKMQYEVTNY